MTSSLAPAPDRHRIERVRHEPRRRALTVKAVARLTPRMIRVTLAGPNLAGFTSASYDDHVKLFFPNAAPPPVDGEEAPKPIGRDFTPRRYDAAAGELIVDFAVHEAGPATEWAVHAAVGDTLNIGGPRGSFVVATDFDWYLLIGDETALPAIGRRLEELPSGAQAIVIAEVADAAEQQIWQSQATVTVHWLHRGAAAAGTTTLLEDAVRGLSLPSGDGYAWAACESLIAKRLRAILVDIHAVPKVWIKAAGYWRHGATGVHETHND